MDDPMVKGIIEAAASRVLGGMGGDSRQSFLYYQPPTYLAYGSLVVIYARYIRSTPLIPLEQMLTFVGLEYVGSLIPPNNFDLRKAKEFVEKALNGRSLIPISNSKQ